MSPIGKYNGNNESPIRVRGLIQKGKTMQSPIGTIYKFVCVYMCRQCIGDMNKSIPIPSSQLQWEQYKFIPQFA